ncbi:MAG: PmoA family protein [Bryobacteraceae bacterium]
MRILSGFLVSAALLAAGGPVLEQRDGKIEVKLDGKLFTGYHYSDRWDKPFLHPILSGSGEVVTRGWPVDPLPGDSNDHTWHRGLWYGHGDVNGVDFWREKGRDLTGRMIPKRPPQPKGDRITADLALVAPDGKHHGTIRESLRFYSDDAARYIDIEVTLMADAGMPMKFGDTEEGALGFRFSDDFREDRGAKMRNSEGAAGKPIWGKRARWTDYSVERKGKPLGVAIMDHPSNPRHPTYWHARDYGLNSVNPFGVRDFTKDKSQDGSLTVPAGGKTVFRYRVAIHEDADPEKLYQTFAKRK